MARSSRERGVKATARILTQCNFITFSLATARRILAVLSYLIFELGTCRDNHASVSQLPHSIGDSGGATRFPLCRLVVSAATVSFPNKTPRNDWTSSQLLRRAICCSQLMNLRHLLLHVLDVNQKADSVITPALGTLVSSVNQLPPLSFDVQ